MYWCLAIIAVSVLLGAWLYRAGQDPDPMNAVAAAQKRIFAYVLWAVAVLTAIYCYAVHRENADYISKANMWHAKARMCGIQSAQLPSACS